MIEQVSSGGAFTCSVISYTVDGLTEYALLDVPNSALSSHGYPVVVIDHGYIVPSQYSTTTSYASIATFFANNGYIVIKPDYRGNGNSQGANDPLQRYNYPVDVLTLIASLASIPHADTSHVYLWGHSMGGEVTLTVLEVLGRNAHLGKGIQAAVLWAPVTDPAAWFSKRNLQKIPEAKLTPFPYEKTFTILGQPSESSPLWQSINPLTYLDSITIPVQINHGTADETVAYASSQDLLQKMQQAHRSVTFLSYEGADHNLSPDTLEALQNNLHFFASHK